MNDMDELMQAVSNFTQKMTKDRKYCPHCMRMLPQHDDDCQLGKLMGTYQRIFETHKKVKR